MRVSGQIFNFFTKVTILPKEAIMLSRRWVIFGAVFLVATFAISFAGVARADSIGPAQEQEYIDAKNALAGALKAQAEQFAPTHVKQVNDLLQAADNARQARDAERFGRACRLARTYAELAKALAELKAEEEKLAAAGKALQQAKTEIEDLKKSQ